MSRISAACAELPALGPGIIWSTAIEPLLENRPELFPVVELEPQTTWVRTGEQARPYRMDREVLHRLQRFPGRKLVHSVGAPVGGTIRPEPVQLALLAEIIAMLDVPWASEHLSFNHTPDFATGFLLPPRQTADGIALAARSIGDLQRALPVPVAIETGVSYLRPRADEMSDAAFVRGVVERADCGLLLDLHNVWCNSVNGRQDIDAYLAAVPLERVWEIHLAGGFEMEGFWLDAHSGSIPDALYALAERLVPQLPNLRAVVFEIFPSFVPVVGLDLVQAQMERLQALWDLRRPVQATPLPSRPVEISTRQGVTPAQWERALGSAVLGRSSGDELGEELLQEPGVRIVQQLVHEFSASMIVRVLNLTARLLMLTLGPPAFRTLLADFWARGTPQMYANLEAEAFGDYLAGLDLGVPHLASVLAFERASARTLVDGKTRIVAFEVEPLPLLRALADGRLPVEPGRLGSYEIEITPEDVDAMAAGDFRRGSTGTPPAERRAGPDQPPRNGNRAIGSAA